MIAPVLDYAESFASSRAATAEQRRSLGKALQTLRACAVGWERDPSGEPCPPIIYIPLLVYAGTAGSQEPAIPLAAATSLLYAGLDLFDDVADGDCPAEWAGSNTAEMNLTAATLLCSLPQLLIAELDAPADVRVRMQHTLASGLLKMAAGQQQGLGPHTGNIRAADVQAGVVRKSGEEFAIFARLAAEFAQAPDGVVGTYEEMARCLGTGGQLASDCHDLFQDPAARDLAHGARTFPIALYLDRIDGEERAAFLDLLDQARTEEVARESVRNVLRSRGVLRACAFTVETYCRRALRLCDETGAAPEARRRLKAMIEGMSFFPPRVAAAGTGL